MGIVLAKSRIPSITAHLLSLLTALTWTAFLTSRVLVSATGLPLEAAVVELDRQLVAWISVLLGGGTTAGSYVFLFLLGLLLWLVAYFSAWAIFRWQRVWWAVIVCGVALMLNITYAPKNLTGYLIAFALFALLLVVRTSLAFYQQEWRVAKVGYSPELVYAFLRAGLTITVLAILLAWVAPVALASRPMQDVWDTVAKPWEQLKEESNRLFQDLNYERERAFIYFDRSMTFGGPVNLTDTPVMDVEATSGRYWRVMVYHDYTGTGWTNTDHNTILIEENEARLETPSFAFRREVTQTVTLHQDLGPQGIIAAAGQPLRSALPLSAVVSYVEPDDNAQSEADSPPPSPVPADASALYSRLALREGDGYQVTSSLTRVDEESLQQSGTEYPEWVVPRYLQLPDSVPERVIDLAEEITAGYDNPYDRANAVEEYLREITYDEQISGPAPGQDGVDYFLFDVQAGYCEYYSSAMVVMLRAVGVPARYVEGYSQGQREDGAYHILESDGHAWPEVFFPGYGWVEFEPTGGEPSLVRPRSQNTGASNRNNAVRPDDLRGERMEDMFEDGGAGLPGQSMRMSLLQQASRWGGVVLVAAGLTMLLAALLTYRRRRHVEGLNAAERVYQDMANWVSRLLRTSPLAHQTPYEYGAAVVAVLPSGRRPVRRIVDTYVGYRFGGRNGDDEQVERAWRDTLKALWRRWFEQKADRVLSIPRRLFPRAAEPPVWQEPPHQRKR
jgi:transglutaminase-like putative cysteine protease